MPQSLAQIYLHVVFSTKGRHPFLRDPVLRRDVFAYLAGTCKSLGSPAVIVGGHVDHVHVVSRLSRSIMVEEVARALKVESSKRVKERGTDLADFRWQAGYGAFSISPSHVPALVEYVENQDAHHESVSFEEEFRRLLQRYNVDYDERYVWD